jgi:hypothetical protein
MDTEKETNVYMVSGATNNSERLPFFSLIYKIDKDLNGSALSMQIANSIEKELGIKSFTIINIINMSSINQ